MTFDTARWQALRRGCRDAAPLEMDLVPVSETVFAATGGGSSFSDEYVPVVFSSLTDGTDCVYIGMRATPRSAPVSG